MFQIFSRSQKRKPRGIRFRVFLVLRWRLGGVQGSLREDLDDRIPEGGLLRLAAILRTGSADPMAQAPNRHRAWELLAPWFGISVKNWSHAVNRFFSSAGGSSPEINQQTIAFHIKTHEIKVEKCVCLIILRPRAPQGHPTQKKIEDDLPKRQKVPKRATHG